MDDRNNLDSFNCTHTKEGIMTLRVNTNVAALNAHRNVQKVNADSVKNLERLSSGMRINTAADGPANLVVSEIMRSQISGLKQAVENSENGVSMVQTAEGALSEVNRLLTNMRQLAVHASNVGVNDERMVAADQSEFANSVKSINRIATNTQFGDKQLLDGSRGANGVANGAGLQFVSASPNTKTSPTKGYEVAITQAATRAQMEGGTALDQDIINSFLNLNEHKKFGYKFESKSLLKSIFKNDIHSYSKKKWGLQSPFAKWMKNSLQKFLYEILNEGYYSNSRNYFNFNEIANLLKRHKEEYFNPDFIWSLVMIQIFLRKFRL